MEPDVWSVKHGTCEYCDQPIHSVGVWTHVTTGQERCAGRDTRATPRAAAR